MAQPTNKDIVNLLNKILALLSDVKSESVKKPKVLTNKNRLMIAKRNKK